MFIVPIKPMDTMEYSPSGATQKQAKGTGAFQYVLDSAVNALNDSQRASREDAYRLAFGDVDNIAEVMINTLKAETMIQTTVQVTSRVVAAYKEIMNIQI